MLGVDIYLLVNNIYVWGRFAGPPVGSIYNIPPDYLMRTYYSERINVNKHKPFIALSVQGEMGSLTPEEMGSYFKVIYTPVSYISTPHKESVMIELEKAESYYEKQPLKENKKRCAFNMLQCSHIPKEGIETIPDYLYLKVILINDILQLGLFTSQKLEKGAWVGTYAGEVFPSDYPSRSLHAMRIFDPTTQSNLQVDAKNTGNHTRFCNHSYNPNVVNKLAFYKGMYHVILYTLRVIEPHEQLLYNYGKDYWENLGVEPQALS